MHRLHRPPVARWPHRAAGIALGLSALVAGGCSTSRELGEIEVLIRAGDFDAAVARAAELHADDPEDEELARGHRRATVAWLLERGRRATFQENDEEALAYFNEAYHLTPGNPVVRDWIVKTSVKLSDRWLDRAHDLEAQGELTAAREAFERAIGYTPDSPQAIGGAARMLVVENYRRGLGEQYYQDGVRRLREALLLQARQNFSYTTKYIPGDERAADRTRRVRRQLAGERLAVALNFEAQNLFPAARTEYRIVLLLDPGNPEAEEGLTRAEREGRALAKLELADMLVRKNRLDEARAALDEGLALTEAQVEEFELKRIDIEENALRKLYERGLDHESDFLYEDAVAVYAEILERADYFEDTIARKETLEEYIRLAAELYERLLAVQTEEDQLDILLQIETFWPEYRDVDERLRRLEPERR